METILTRLCILPSRRPPPSLRKSFLTPPWQSTPSVVQQIMSSSFLIAYSTSTSILIPSPSPLRLSSPSPFSSSLFRRQ